MMPANIALGTGFRKLNKGSFWFVILKQQQLHQSANNFGK